MKPNESLYMPNDQENRESMEITASITNHMNNPENANQDNSPEMQKVVIHENQKPELLRVEMEAIFKIKNNENEKIWKDKIQNTEHPNLLTFGNGQ